MSGLQGFIVPSAMMLQPRYADVGKLLHSQTIHHLWNLGDRVFGASVVAPSCIFIVEKAPPRNDQIVLVLDMSLSKSNAERLSLLATSAPRSVQQSVFDRTVEGIFVTYYRPFKKNEIELGNVLDCKDCGIKHQRVGCGLEEKGKSDLVDRLYYEGQQQASTDHRFLIGGDLAMTGWKMHFSNERYFRDGFKKILRSDEIVYFNQTIFDLPEKIVWRQTSDRIRATIVGPHWFANTLQAGVLKDRSYDIRYILGLLNSAFLNFLYIENVKEGGRVFPQVKLSKVRSLPFRTIDFELKEDVNAYARLTSLVTSMLSLHTRLSTEQLPQRREQLQREIDATDRQIDQLVYQLYGLTDDEIRIVEEATA